MYNWLFVAVRGAHRHTLALVDVVDEEADEDTTTAVGIDDTHADADSVVERAENAVDVMVVVVVEVIMRAVDVDVVAVEALEAIAATSPGQCSSCFAGSPLAYVTPPPTSPHTLEIHIEA